MADLSRRTIDNNTSSVILVLNIFLAVASVIHCVSNSQQNGKYNQNLSILCPLEDSSLCLCNQLLLLVANFQCSYVLLNFWIVLLIIPVVVLQGRSHVEAREYNCLLVT